MAFNTGLSGLRAASVDLDVTGNNIANASTVGFKGSKAQFGDLYASGFLSSGNNQVGNGVRVQDVKQSFGQGNISDTGNGLDMAINGDGFFVLSNGGETRYSRAGQFGIDKEGFVTNNQNMRVQGYTADGDGNLSGVRGDLQVETDNLAPKRTTNLRSDLNLDSRESILENRVRDLGEDLSVADLDGDIFQIEYSDGTTSQPITIGTDQPANEVAELLGSQKGVNASARTQFDLSEQFDMSQLVSDLSDPDFELTISLNGSDNVTFRGSDGITDLDSMAAAINDSELNTLQAQVLDTDGDGTGDDMSITDSRGFTIEMTYTTGGAGNQSFSDSSPESERGNLFVTTEREVTGVLTDPSGTGAFEAAFDAGETRITNEFNPLDQRTYNHATSTTIYDSLGNSHELTQFFVKEPSPGNGVGQSEWSIYMQIDGEVVAGTDETPYTARFNQDGKLQSINGDPNGEVLIDDWVPKDENGLPNGADGPPADGEEVLTPIPEPPTTSAFVVDLGNTTQYGSAFGVNDQNQNGYTTGRLAGLDVSDQGILFARYTNGQSQGLGQVALAAFNNTDGLSPVGDTTWVETFESGQPIIGAPDTGTLGSIAASSVEESNVDLSAELVNLIIAQRNYQANAKTIETSDAVTQTIINLR
ncbi:flagellar hook protein FlgE [Marinobacter sp.]|uniref:flagellar hook protein FlgE n=1 Tax=Marinobacter sp. TaxID=50741 RepID=UPI0034A225CB